MVDLTEQWNSIYQKLEADWDIVCDSWDDRVRDTFQERYVQKMKDCINAYLQGDYGRITVKGVGLIELVHRIEDAGQKISSLSGVPFSPSSLEEQLGNDYINLEEPLLNEYNRVKNKFRNEREEEILVHETDDIIYDRKHDRYKSIIE